MEFGMGALAVATAVLTLALVAITAWYAISTRQMVDEMRRGREQAQRPAMALDVNTIGPKYGLARITNVGAGAAFDVRLTLRLELRGGGVDERVWEAPVILSGGGESFFGPPDDRNVLSGAVSRIGLTGTMRDSLGQTVEVSEQIADLVGWWTRRENAARHRPLQGGERERQEQIIEALNGIKSEIGRVRRGG
ncbi:MAG: hypothetical protein QOI48_1345 [Solirubrobacteraceae bacterium]|jgi:hypothetical protein|nr:hypothetical protein [Solirubrobacteraceae bacterium]